MICSSQKIGVGLKPPPYFSRLIRHIAVDTLGHLLGLVVTPANEQDRAQVQELAQQAIANHG